MKSLNEEDASLLAWVEAARLGEREALEKIVAALQHDLYRLALRMTACLQDAEDATQEIVVKIITRLDSFRGDASLRTWAYRIAVRHLLDRRKSRTEALSLSFERFGAELLDGLSSTQEEDPLAVEEVKRGCTLAMLTCLDREHRIAFILVEVFSLSCGDAASLCEISQESFRQRLSRARRDLQAFTESYCGLVRERAPCRCSKRVQKAEQLGRLHREELRLARHPTTQASEEMEGLHEAARLMRSHPAYAAPGAIFERIRGLLRDSSTLLMWH